MKKIIILSLILLPCYLMAGETEKAENSTSFKQKELFMGRACSVGGVYLICGKIKDKYYGGCSISCSCWSRADLALCSQATCISGEGGEDWVRAARCVCSE